MDSVPKVPEPADRQRGGLLLLGSAVTAAGWLFSGLLAEIPLQELLPILFAQTALAALLLALLASDSPNRLEAGPGAVTFLALHGLIFYGLANIAPAFFRNLRPFELRALMEWRIPPAPVDAYTAATIAAIGLLAGAAAGAGIVSRAFRVTVPSSPGARTVSWLPGAATAAASLAVVAALVVAGTVRFGLGFGLTLTDEAILQFDLLDQLLFHGLISFLLLGPALAAAVYIQSRRIGALGTGFLGIIGVLLVVLIAVWRMRSTAIIAAALPIALLGLTGKLDVRRWLAPAVLLLLGIYAAVTAVRVSDIGNVVLEGGERNPAARDLLAAAARRGPDETVVSRTVFDLSYRAAGLEAVAALIEAQQDGRLDVQGFRVTGSGYLQSLPARLRPQQDMPLKVKTAPSTLGIFGEGDWVTTILSEGVMDCGMWGTALYGFLAGFLICLVERALLRLGSLPVLDVLLVLRYAFLAYLLYIGADLPSMTATFFKATIGFLGVLLAASFLIFLLRMLAGAPSRLGAEKELPS